MTFFAESKVKSVATDFEPERPKQVWASETTSITYEKRVKILAGLLGFEAMEEEQKE